MLWVKVLQVYKCSFYCFAALVQAQLYSMTADHVASYCALFQQLSVGRDLELFVWDLDPDLKTLLLICYTHTLMTVTSGWVWAADLHLSAWGRRRDAQRYLPKVNTVLSLPATHIIAEVMDCQICSTSEVVCVSYRHPEELQLEQFVHEGTAGF